MEDGSGHAQRPEVHRVQRRRRRFGHVRRPPADGRRPLRADRRHDHRRPRSGRKLRLYLRALGISARHRHAGSGHCARPQRGLAGRGRTRQRSPLRPGSAQGRGRLHLRRRNLVAGKPGGQARRGARQAAAARHLGPVRQAHRDQQRDLAGHGAHHPGQGRQLLPRLRRGPFAWHAALPVGGQPEARRVGGKGLWPEPARPAL
ncbi:hypothetical protein D3C73_1032430 [compost metagenome]